MKLFLISRKRLSSVIFLFLLLLSSLANAGYNYVKPRLSPIEQNIFWEEQANISQFKKTTIPQKMILVPYDREEVDVKIDNDMPKEAKNMLGNFIDVDTIYFPIHPYAKSKEIHWVKKYKKMKMNPFKKAHLPEIKVLDTASRTVYFVNQYQQGLVAVKAPTDYLVNERGQKTNEPEKTHLGLESKSSWESNMMIKKIDKDLGDDPELLLLHEIAWFRLKSSTDKRQNGYMLRDITPLANGNYYLPGFAIPYVGREIAAINGVSDWERFWGIHYARNLGKLKAKLLLRYGIQMITPNAQNFLVELDPRYKPTGRIVMRDIEDTWFVPSVTKAVLAHHNIPNDFMKGWQCQDEEFDYIRIFWVNSCWKFDLVSVPYKIETKLLSNKWFSEHLWGYLNEINKSLKSNIKPYSAEEMNTPEGIAYHTKMTSKKQYDSSIIEARFSKAIIDYISSDEGQERLKRFHSR